MAIRPSTATNVSKDAESSHATFDVAPSTGVTGGGRSFEQPKHQNDSPTNNNEPNTKTDLFIIKLPVEKNYHSGTGRQVRARL